MRAGLYTKDGNAIIRWADMDPVRDAELIGTSPATLAAIKAANASRADEIGEQFTASEAGDPLRILMLKRTAEIFEHLPRTLAAEQGTARHETTNREAQNIICERRLYNADRTISMKFDQLVIVGWELIDGVVVCTTDLWDLKTGGYYAAKKYPVEAQSHAYTMQMNLGAHLLETMPSLEAWDLVADHAPDWVLELPHHIGWRIVVRNIKLEWWPRDIALRDVEAAAAKGERDPALLVYDVPRLDGAEVLAWYEQRRSETHDAIAKGYAPICTPDERWEGWSAAQKAVIPKRCLYYCGVKQACIEMSLAKGEPHPLVPDAAEVAS